MTRAQIDRIARQVDRLASNVNAENMTHVPIYDGESEAEALRATALRPTDVRRLLAQIDGRTRGIPESTSIESFRGSEH